MRIAKDPGSDVRANAQTALRARRTFFMRSANHKWQSCVTSVLPFIFRQAESRGMCRNDTGLSLTVFDDFTYENTAS
jgi:hypothetical protein